MNPPQMQQYARAWDQGTFHQIPDQEAYQQYQQFMQNAPPDVIERIHQQYYQHMPAQQRGNLIQGILNGLMQRGVRPQQLGIQNANPDTMSPNDAARLTSYAQQNSPDLLQHLLSPNGPLGSPVAKAAIAGVVALAAKHFLGGDRNF
jgi:hypothetical protein